MQPNLNYPLTIYRGASWSRGFKFLQDGNIPITDIVSVTWSAGIGDTLFVRHSGTKDGDTYYVNLSPVETRALQADMRYEVQLKYSNGDEKIYLAGPLSVSLGENPDG